jgi:hypothetical protein
MLSYPLFPGPANKVVSLWYNSSFKEVHVRAAKVAAVHTRNESDVRPGQPVYAMEPYKLITSTIGARRARFHPDRSKQSPKGVGAMGDAVYNIWKYYLVA